MTTIRALLVDDEPAVLTTCARVLESTRTTTVQSESSVERAVERIRDEDYDVVISDIRMPGGTGLELLKVARERDPELPFVLITGYPTMETALEAIRHGASAYVLKPIAPDELINTVERVVEAAANKREVRLLRRQLRRDHIFGSLIGESDPMVKVKNSIERFGNADVDVLVVGETGTGKELVARSIHEASPRAGGPFVPVDCGAIPETLFESELFGYERGAFTGATTRGVGLLQLADGGTFFLDELFSMPVALQAKLLRAVQERQFRRIGGKDYINVDVRIVAAINVDPQDGIRNGQLREDLYYRVNVGRVDLPPLRDRGEDVALLVEHFVNTTAEQMGRPRPDITAEAVEVLIGYDWPGNVRQLQNIIKRALALTPVGESVPVDSIPDEIVSVSRTRTDDLEQGLFELRDQKIAAFEKEHMTRLLEQHNGDVAACARAAKVPRGTFYRLMKKHDLEAKAFRG